MTSRPTTIYMPEELRRLAKAHGLNLSAFVRECLENHLKVNDWRKERDAHLAAAKALEDVWGKEDELRSKVYAYAEGLESRMHLEYGSDAEWNLSQDVRCRRFGVDSPTMIITFYREWRKLKGWAVSPREIPLVPHP